MVELHRTRCAICGSEENATELYPANFDPAALDAAVFSARRLPDRLHARMVRCNADGLIRSDPVPAADALARLYAESAFEYGAEVDSLRQTYGRYLAKLEQHGVVKGSLLEIGCGNGFFLEEARARGYARVSGVEPSVAAIAAADERIRPHIVRDVLRRGLFPAESFDVICAFQVFDHVPDPDALLAECRALLKPGGLVLFLNHNVTALSARLLGERSPIVDIEHTYLYSPRTMRRLFAAHRLRVREAGAVFNVYSLRYLARLVPLPTRVKRVIVGALAGSRVGRVRVSVPLGNLYVIARRVP